MISAVSHILCEKIVRKTWSSTLMGLLIFSTFLTAFPQAAAVKDLPPITLTSPNSQAAGWFGQSVAVGGGYIVIGAGHDYSINQQYYSGNVYIYNEADGTLLATLSSPNPVMHGGFGESVAISTRPDRSGVYVVVSAPRETVKDLSYAGRVYVYTVDGASAQLVATLTRPKPLLDGMFGSSVATDGELVVIGAERETVDGIAYAGRVYVFSTSHWKLLWTLTSPDPEFSGSYGWSVAVDGNVFVGAPRETVNNVDDAGIVYKYCDGALISTLTSTNPIGGGGYGFSVAVHGGWLVVGAPFEQYQLDHAQFYGRTYVYDTSITGELYATLTPYGKKGQEYGGFGYSVSVNSTNIVVGAPGEVHHGKSGGQAYVYTISGQWVTTLTSPNAQDWGGFGHSVAVDRKIVVGAYLESLTGNAYVFT